VSAIINKIPLQDREKVTDITMDFSDSMQLIAESCFPNAKITIDCFHVIQRLCEGLEELRLKEKREAATENKRAVREFRQNEEKKARQRAY